jgi:parallel beta-helix repeat protein
VVDTSGVAIEGNSVHDNESAISVGQYYATPVAGIAIRNNTVDNNDWGIQVINNASGTIVEGNTVTNQNGDGFDVWNYGWPWTSDPTGTEVHNNNIVGSGFDGAWTNVTAEVVDMENNWWGDASGPYDPANDAGETTGVPPCTASPASEINADGLGDSVGDTSTEVIDYCPWLSSAPAGAPATLAVPLAPKSRSVKSENPSVVQPIE